MDDMEPLQDYGNLEDWESVIESSGADPLEEEIYDSREDWGEC